MNPWQVENLDAFTYICCPECTYRTKDAVPFECHALQNHPDAKLFFFHKINQEIKIIDDIFYQEDTLVAEEDPLEHVVIDDSILVEEAKPVIDDKNHCIQDDKECQSCNEKFLRESELESHIQNSHQYLLSCLSCEIMFENKACLLKHQKKRKSKKLCLKCSQKKTFDSECDYNIHLKNCSVSIKSEDIGKVNKPKKSERYPCLLCPLAFKNPSLRSKHALEEHTGLVQCPQCLRSFDDYEKLKDHIHYSHPKQDKTITCSKCQKTFSKTQHYNRHMLTVHADRSDNRFHCDHCDFKTYANEFLLHHKRTKHNVLHKTPYKNCTTKSDPKEKPVCEHCGKVMASKSTLYHHLKIHENETKIFEKDKVYSCSLCNAECTGRVGYMTHYQRSHHSFPPEMNRDSVQCDLCGKVVLTKNLKLHIKVIHEKTWKVKKRPSKHKMLQCPHCDKSFMNRANLNGHKLRVHENRLAFECEECSKKFPTLTALKNHKGQTHAKVQCDLCEAQLYNIHYLRLHKAEVHDVYPENSFSCAFCPKFFMHEITMKKHVESKHS